MLILLMYGQSGFAKSLSGPSPGVTRSSVVKQTRDYAEVDITEFIEEKDGSILPKKTTGYIQPPKNLGLKLTDVIIPRKQNNVLKISCVDVQQGDGSVIESPEARWCSSTVATTSFSRAT